MIRKKSKVLLINLKYDFVPINFAFIISSLIKHNIKYDFLDMQLDNNLEEKVSSGEYYAACIGGLSLNYYNISNAFKRIKKIAPEVQTILGSRISGMPVEFLNKLKVDFIIQEDAEPTLPQLLNLIKNNCIEYKSIDGIAYRKNGILNFTPKPQLIPLDDFAPTWKDINLQWYLDNQMTANHSLYRSYPLIVGVGCVGRCVFCAPQTRSHRIRKVSSVIHELQTVITKYKVKSISIMSEIFYNTIKEAKEFYEAYINAGIDKPIYAMIRPDFDDQILEYLVKAGCKHIFIGVESYDDNALKKMGKKTSVKDIDRIIKKVKSLNVLYSCGFLIGNPGDTTKSLEKTTNFFINNKITSSTIGGSGVIIFPGSASYRIAKQKGLISNEKKYLKTLSQRNPLARLTPDYGLGKMYPNITTLSNNELWKQYSEIYLKMYNFQMKYFLATSFDWKTNIAICHTCGNKIKVSGSPATMYLCSDCLAPNFVFMHNLLLKQSSNMTKIIKFFHKNKKIIITGTFNSIYALVETALRCNKNPQDLIILSNKNVTNHFKAALNDITCIQFSEIKNINIDGLIHFGLHCPKHIEKNIAKACDINKSSIINATPENFKKIHKKNINSNKFYFEYTFTEDMFFLGKLIGKMLYHEYRNDVKWLLPSEDTYAKAINKGILTSSCSITNNAKSATGAIINAQRLQDATNDKTQLLKKHKRLQHNILTLKDNIYSKIWDKIFIDDKN